jgi:hypothetical protein
LRLTALRLNACFAHATCPGFKAACTGSWRTAWDRLRYYTDGFAWADPMLEASPDIFDPGRNPDVRIVFLYRNPFDQAVSFYGHARNHKNEALLVPVVGGTVREIGSPLEYFRLVGLETYLKLYLSYRFMRSAHPKNVLLVPYERMVTDRSGTFAEILNFLGAPPQSDLARHSFAKALRLTDRPHLRRAEELLGHPLATDQRDARDSHLPNGKIGTWRQHFAASDIYDFAENLSRYGLTLEEFFLG